MNYELPHLFSVVWFVFLALSIARPDDENVEKFRGFRFILAVLICSVPFLHSYWKMHFISDKIENGHLLSLSGSLVEYTPHKAFVDIKIDKVEIRGSYDSLYCEIERQGYLVGEKYQVKYIKLEYSWWFDEECIIEFKGPRLTKKSRKRGGPNA